MKFFRAACSRINRADLRIADVLIVRGYRLCKYECVLSHGGVKGLFQVLFCYADSRLVRYQIEQYMRFGRALIVAL